MTDDEIAELAAAEQNKREVAQPIIDEYNKVYRKLKTRCDARMRRSTSNSSGETEA